MRHSGKNSNKKASFKLTISQKAKKEMKKLPLEELKKIDEKILLLIKDPYQSNSKKLAGTNHTYRLRQGNYRIIYEVAKKEICIMAVGHRKEIYR